MGLPIIPLAKFLPYTTVVVFLILKKIVNEYNVDKIN